MEISLCPTCGEYFSNHTQEKTIECSKKAFDYYSRMKNKQQGFTMMEVDVKYDFACIEPNCSVRTPFYELALLHMMNTKHRLVLSFLDVNSMRGRSSDITQ